MKNVHSSDGIAEDMIRSFIQFGCSEIHAKTLFEKINAKLNNGLIELDEALPKIELYQSLIDKYSELRRGVMLKLFDMYDGDKDVWCLVKHLGIGMFTSFEAYQASDNDARLMEIWLDANSAFTEAMSIFLGIEITDCAACFADMLKGE